MALAKEGDFDSQIVLTEEVKIELKWWVQDLHLNNGRTVLTSQSQLLIISDASLEGWETIWN